jgi:predicted Rossmann-fold nucleotide-binding protein
VALARWTSYSSFSPCSRRGRRRRTYWLKLINFEMLAEEGMIAPADLQLFEFAESAEEAWASFRRGLQSGSP